MSKSAPSAPAAPSPRKQVDLQARANPDVVSPFGTVNYSGRPSAGNYKQEITLSPEQQRLYKGRTDIAEAMLGKYPQGYEFNGAEDPTTNRFFMNQKAMLDKVFAEDEERLDQKLVNQGLPMGAEAYNEEFDKFRRTKADAYEAASTNALQAGFGQDLAQRQQAYNEIAAALGGSQLTPVSAGGGGGLDVAGAFANQQAGRNAGYQGQIAAHQAEVGTTNAALGAAGTVGSAYMLAAFI